jgi:mRNA-degrading endonuclease RelE of RelBE toxin-antitoxin system
MKMQWQTLISEDFLNDLIKLSARDMCSVMGKIALLAQDPRPDGKLKKHLLHCKGKLFRIRFGDYRIFYTFNQRYVYIRGLGRKNEDTYKDYPEGGDIPNIQELDDLTVGQ